MKPRPLERRAPQSSMQQSIFRNKAALGAFLVTLASGCVTHLPEQGSPEPYLTRPEAVQLIPAGTQGTATGEKTQGIIVYIDPESGEFTTPPSEAMPAQRPQQSLERAGEPAAELHEILSPVPGGGVAVRLDERFSTPLSATIDADGKVRFEHLPTLPDSRDKK
jgi:hypothetical protein